MLETQQKDEEEEDEEDEDKEDEELRDVSHKENKLGKRPISLPQFAVRPSVEPFLEMPRSPLSLTRLTPSTPSIVTLH